MKRFELLSKAGKNGRRKFKAILYQVYPDSCVDTVNQVGTVYNENGITFLEKYCRAALPSIEGMSLRVEFLDDERTEISGHGKTDYVDGLPVFEDAVVIGTFTKGYIDTVETEDGPILACIGEGWIDAQCYHNFVTKLDADIANGEYPSGSIELLHTSDHDEIIYLYGYKDEGRIPVEFVHSGYALLAVRPADKVAKLIELNEKHEEEKAEMDKVEMTELIKQVAGELNASTATMNQYKADCDAKVAEANTAKDSAVAELNEAIATSAQLQAALDAAHKELEEKYKELDALHEELDVLRDELGKAKAAERLGALDNAIADFTEEQIGYAETEIAAFKADPVNGEINSVVNKIYEGLGRKAADDAAAQKAAEANAAKEQFKTNDDIFGDIQIVEDDVDIF